MAQRVQTPIPRLAVHVYFSTLHALEFSPCLRFVLDVLLSCRFYVHFSHQCSSALLLDCSPSFGVLAYLASSEFEYNGRRGIDIQSEMQI